MLRLWQTSAFLMEKNKNVRENGMCCVLIATKYDACMSAFGISTLPADLRVATSCQSVSLKGSMTSAGIKT